MCLARGHQLAGLTVHAHALKNVTAAAIMVQDREQRGRVIGGQNSLGNNESQKKKKKKEKQFVFGLI